MGIGNIIKRAGVVEVTLEGADGGGGVVQREIGGGGTQRYM